MKNDEIFYSLEGHNSKYGICQHTCKNGKWQELKNCCCGSQEDNDWHFCGDTMSFPPCDETNEGLVIYTNCFPNVNTI